MRVERLDHLVLTVTDLTATIGFYTTVCGMSHVVFGKDQRHGLTFGQQKINLHVWGSEFEPKAALSTPGSADLCFVVDSAPQQVVERLTELQVPIVAGPGPRNGALGEVTSVYVRDPDGNLIEFACYEKAEAGASGANNAAASDGRATAGRKK